MSVSTDMSIMDFLFQRNDSSLNSDLTIKHEVMDVDFNDLSTNNYNDDLLTEEWPASDEFFNTILNSDEQLCNVLESTPPSSCSDSGLSSDHHDLDLGDQLILGDDDDILSTTLSSPGPSVSEAGGNLSPGHSEENISVQNHPDVYHIPELSNEHVVIKHQDPKVKVNSIRIQNKPLQTVTILNQKNTQQNKLAGTVRQVIRVQPMNSNNPRSILLPVSVKDLRTIKIISPSGKKTPANIKLAAANLLQQTKKSAVKNSMIIKHIDEQCNEINVPDASGTSDDDIYDGSNSETSVNSSSYPRLQLTSEEQRLLAKEGISLPTSYPLTKHEERELKRIRRKIRNKISAQDSRKRKKEYVDGLEDRVKQCTEENQTLLKRIKVLQTQNQTLVSQLRRLQALVSRKMMGAVGDQGQGASTAIGKAQPATCLMVLLLSLALISVPSLKRGGGNNALSSSTDMELESKMDEYVGKRALLFSKPGEEIDEEINMDELLTFHNDHHFDAPAVKRSRLDSQKFDEISLDGFDKSDPVLRKYIEPPLDDVWPPPIVQQNQILNDGVESKHNLSHPNNVVVLRVEEDK